MSGMSEPILAIDFGTTTSAAVLVTRAGEEPIEEPSGHGRTWPSAVSLDGRTLRVGTLAERRKRMHPELYRTEFKPELGRPAAVRLGSQDFAIPELITAVLAEVRQAAERVAGSPVTRSVLTIPASYQPGDQRRALLIEAAERAGFTSVELLAEPVAASLAPAAGTPLAVGSLVLVYDFGGGTFDTALVRIGALANEVLGHAAIDQACGGRDIDAALYQELTASGGTPLEELLKSGRARIQLADQARHLKHQLSDAGTADDYFGDSEIVLAATREQVAALAEPFISQTLECVSDLLTETGTDLDDVTAVLLVGGVTRMPVVAQTIETKLGRPVRIARSPELAVVQGAARFAALAETRFRIPVPQRMPERPLRWQLPGGSATLLRWRVASADVFDPGEVLGQIRLGDGSIWALKASRPGRVLGLHAAPGATVCSGDWLLTAEELAPSLLLKPESLVTVTHADEVSCVAFSPDGQSFATGSDDKSAQVWDTRTGALRRMVRHDGSVYAVAFTPDSGQLGTGSLDYSARIWELSTGRQLARFECGDGVDGIAFTPDGSGLATAGADVRVWNVSDGTHVVKVDRPVADVCISPDGSCIASTHGDDPTRITSMSDGELITQITHDGTTWCIAYSPDGNRVITGDDNGQIGIWDALTGENALSFTHGGNTLYSVAFSPECTYVASCGADETARVWDAATGDELMCIQQKGAVYGVAFSPDGKLLATAGDGNAATIWQIRY
jgi:WD40 repeat protein